MQDAFIQDIALMLFRLSLQSIIFAQAEELCPYSYLIDYYQHYLTTTKVSNSPEYLLITYPTNLIIRFQ